MAASSCLFIKHRESGRWTLSVCSVNLLVVVCFLWMFQLCTVCGSLFTEHKLSSLTLILRMLGGAGRPLDGLFPPCLTIKMFPIEALSTVTLAGNIMSTGDLERAGSLSFLTLRSRLQASLLNKRRTCWWCGWSRVCRWLKAPTRPWAGTTWWKSRCRRERWWRTWRRRLSPRRRSIPVCTAAAATAAATEAAQKINMRGEFSSAGTDVKTLAAVCC